MENLDQKRLLQMQRREMLCNTQRGKIMEMKSYCHRKSYVVSVIETIVWHWKIKSAWFMETSNIIRNCVTRNVKLAELSSWMSWAANL